MHTSSWSKIYTVAVAILASGQRLRENKGMMALRTLSAVDVIRCRVGMRALHGFAARGGKKWQKLDSGSASLSHNHLSKIEQCRM